MSFWMIYAENGGPPTYQHPTESGARAEAERLARTNRGKKFYVLKAIADVVAADVSWEFYKDDIPF